MPVSQPALSSSIGLSGLPVRVLQALTGLAAVCLVQRRYRTSYLLSLRSPKGSGRADPRPASGDGSRAVTVPSDRGADWSDASFDAPRRRNSAHFGRSRSQIDRASTARRNDYAALAHTIENKAGLPPHAAISSTSARWWHRGRTTSPPDRARPRSDRAPPTVAVAAGRSIARQPFADASNVGRDEFPDDGFPAAPGSEPEPGMGLAVSRPPVAAHTVGGELPTRHVLGSIGAAPALRLASAGRAKIRTGCVRSPANRGAEAGGAMP